jgi:NAD(P)-dependent dehydrogenase (short-subunit alcohol dehydrogenase family)
MAEQAIVPAGKKVWFITGASRGFGLDIAGDALDRGDFVVATARNPKTVIAALGDQPNLLALKLDVAVESDAAPAAKQAVDTFGRIDVLVNNAASLFKADTLQISGEAWDRVMATNVRGPFVAIRQTARHMMRQRSGSIINITALVGSLTPKSNYPGFLVYGVSKAALNRLSYFMAAELKPYGIAVNCLSPGVVASEAALKANPQVATAGTHKPCTPEALGPALLCLAQQTAETLTGQMLHTDEFQKSWP